MAPTTTNATTTTDADSSTVTDGTVSSATSQIQEVPTRPEGAPASTQFGLPGVLAVATILSGALGGFALLWLFALRRRDHDAEAK